MRQLDAELRRFFARRIVRGAVVMTVLVAIVSIGIITVRGHPPRAGAGRAVPVPVVVTGPNGQQQITYSGGETPAHDTRIDVGRSLENTLQAMAIVMLLISIVLGASFVGADFNVGSLTSQLLYEPRRWRVHLSKAVAVAIGCAVASAVVCIAIGAMVYGGSELHGIVRGIDATWWHHRAVDLGRAIATAAAAGVMAYSVTVVAHRTSAAIVVFLAQFPFIHIAASTPLFGPLSKYAPFRGLLAIATDVHSAAGSDLRIRTNAGAFLFAGAWIVILVGASGVIFARSEVR
jgi:hypothetical protein